MAKKDVSSAAGDVPAPPESPLTPEAPLPPLEPAPPAPEAPPEGAIEPTPEAFDELVEQQEEKDVPAAGALLAEAVAKGILEPNDLVIVNDGDPTEMGVGDVPAPPESPLTPEAPLPPLEPAPPAPEAPPEGAIEPTPEAFDELVEQQEEKDVPAAGALLAEAVAKGILEPNDLVIVNDGDPTEMGVGGTTVPVLAGETVIHNRRAGALISNSRGTSAAAFVGGWSAVTVFNHARAVFAANRAISFLERRPLSDPSQAELLALLGKN